MGQAVRISESRRGAQHYEQSRDNQREKTATKNLNKSKIIHQYQSTTKSQPKKGVPESFNNESRLSRKEAQLPWARRIIPA